MPSVLWYGEQRHTIQDKTRQDKTRQDNTIQYNTTQHNTIQYNNIVIVVTVVVIVVVGIFNVIPVAAPMQPNIIRHRGVMISCAAALYSVRLSMQSSTPEQQDQQQQHITSENDKISQDMSHMPCHHLMHAIESL